MPEPNRVWASDITYVRTYEGWLYLAVVIDLFSRRVVGWSIAVQHANGHRAVGADDGRRATASGPRASSSIPTAARSTRATTTSERFDRTASRCSFSGRGNCWDNAVVESFFGTLKRELIHRRSWPTATKPPQPSTSTSRSSTTVGGATRPSAKGDSPPSSRHFTHKAAQSGSVTKPVHRLGARSPPGRARSLASLASGPWATRARDGSLAPARFARRRPADSRGVERPALIEAQLAA